MEHKKGEIKARVLSIMEGEYAITVPMIEAGTFFPKSTIKDTIRHLLNERCIKKFSLKKEDLDPQEYRTNEMGRMPHFFYQLTPAGEKKLEYFKKIGLLD
jgi:hypothetical protein